MVILMPLYNDWDALLLLLDEVDRTLAAQQLEASILVVDDASTDSAPSLDALHYTAIKTISVLRLRRNLGHQRAIAIGLAWLHDASPAVDLVVVMDADGEDAPAELPALLAAARERHMQSIVFAERTRRSEGLLFAFCYNVYRALHRLLTSERVRFGNFCAIPRSCLVRVVGVSEIWNHFAAGIIRSRIPYAGIPTERARRLTGRPKMNFTALVVHGVSALSVFSDVIGVRALAATGTLGVAAVLAFAVRPALWTGSLPATGLFIALLVQLASLAVIFVFVTLAARKGGDFIPLRDYHSYVLGVTSAEPGAGTSKR